MNTPSSGKTTNHLDHIIYMPLLFFFFFGVFFFLFFFFCFVFSKSAQVGLRLPDCTHIYSNKGFSYSIYNMYQGKKEGWGKKRRVGKYTPTTTKQKKERKKEKSHIREIYVPSIMEKCAPQTDGSAQANVLLVFLRDLF